VKDGAVFGNREGRLPARPRGYYREYTVKTPGSPDRGARRIVGGSNGEFYYTDDHYNTFKLIKD
jgi:ribonuclease T1